MGWGVGWGGGVSLSGPCLGQVEGRRDARSGIDLIIGQVVGTAHWWRSNYRRIGLSLILLTILMGSVTFWLKEEVSV